MSNLIGRKLKNRYQVIESIGRGGMAEVYKVWDEKRSVYLAMKILREDLSEDKIFLRRFKREAQNLALLQHPHIVRYYELEQDGELAFLLMDYVEGSTLRKEIFKTDSPFPNEKLLKILQPVCSALYYAHNLGLVHCDVKPGNIMIRNDGDVFITDFGIARMTDAATATMIGLGSPAYMAPEQIRGLDPTPQTDIYTLGVVLFEMLSGGERPFNGDRAQVEGTISAKIRWEQVNLDPLSLRDFNPNVTPKIEEVVHRCLQKESTLRFNDVLKLLNATVTALEVPPKLKDQIGHEQKALSASSAILVEKELDINHKRTPIGESNGEVEESKFKRQKLQRLIPVIGIAIVITVCFLVSFFSFSKFYHPVIPLMIFQIPSGTPTALNTPKLPSPTSTNTIAPTNTPTFTHTPITAPSVTLEPTHTPTPIPIVWHKTNTLIGHTDKVNSIVFSQDGSIIYSGSSDDTIRIWDVDNGSLFETIKARTLGVDKIQISPDGNTLASTSSFGAIPMWDAHTGKPLKTLTGHGGVVNDIAFSPNNQILASASNDTTIGIWDLTSGILQKLLSNQFLINVQDTSFNLAVESAPAIGVAISLDGNYVQGWFADGKTATWNLSTFDQDPTLNLSNFGRGSSHASWSEEVISADGSTKILSFSSGIIDGERNGKNFEIDSRLNDIQDVALSYDGRSITLVTDDNKIYILGIDPSSPSEIIEGLPENFIYYAFSTDGGLLAVSTDNGEISLFKLE